MADAMKAVRKAMERTTVYIPILSMGLLALGTYWLARNAPMPQILTTEVAPVHEPDYFMRRFAVKTFDAGGQMKSEVFGTEARHFPDTDTLEIDKVRIRSVGPTGLITTATANRALSNGDGSEVQLFGDAVVVRDPSTASDGTVTPRLEFRGEFLHAFLNTERIRSHLPVTLTRGTDRFTADRMDYDNLDRQMNLTGRVRGILVPRGAR